MIDKYGSTEVPNKATVTINDNPRDTNEVQVMPPHEEFDPEKKINGAKKTVELENRDETFTYTIIQKIPYDATSAVFEDKLEDVLVIVGTPTIDAEGGTIDVIGNAVTAKLDEEAAIKARGNTVTLTIKAMIRDDVTDEELIEKYGKAREIPNQATVSINNDPKFTNKVKVTPPEEPTPPAPEKKVNGQTSKVKLSARDEVFTYTISQKIPANAKTIKFTDNLEDVLEIVGKPGVDADGAVITVRGNKVTAELSGKDAIAVRGTTVTLTIKAKIRSNVSDSKLKAKYGTTDVPNRAEVSINNKGQSTNKVLVTPPTKPNNPPSRTGDSSNTAVWIALMLLAGAAAVVTIRYRKMIK